MSEMALIGLNKSNLFYDICSFNRFSILFVYVQREVFNSSSACACMLHIFSICPHKFAEIPLAGSYFKIIRNLGNTLGKFLCQSIVFFIFKKGLHSYVYRFYRV